MQQGVAIAMLWSQVFMWFYAGSCFLYCWSKCFHCDGLHYIYSVEFSILRIWWGPGPGIKSVQTSCWGHTDPLPISCPCAKLCLSWGYVRTSLPVQLLSVTKSKLYYWLLLALNINMKNKRHQEWGIDIFFLKKTHISKKHGLKSCWTQ